VRGDPTRFWGLRQNRDNVEDRIGPARDALQRLYRGDALRIDAVGDYDLKPTTVGIRTGH
jgi:hypothetical protein